MARQSRLQLAGVPHLVALRGNNGQDICLDDVDREHLLSSLRAVAALVGVVVSAWSLGASEVVLLLTSPTPDGISRFVQALGRRYVAAFNRRHHRTGTLWDGRFRSAAIGPTEVLAALRYVECRNVVSPVVSSREWSSRAHHCGGSRDAWLGDPDAYWRLGNTPFEREARYRAFVEDGGPESCDQAFANALKGGRPVGDDVFLAEVEQRTGRSMARRPRGRPRKARTS